MAPSTPSETPRTRGHRMRLVSASRAVWRRAPPWSGSPGTATTATGSTPPTAASSPTAPPPTEGVLTDSDNSEPVAPQPPRAPLFEQFGIFRRIVFFVLGIGVMLDAIIQTPTRTGELVAGLILLGLI